MPSRQCHPVKKFRHNTYQKLVDKIFDHQKGRNVEVYVDDSIVKSLTEETHVVDLGKFGVRSDNFLGFMVSERGIDANPDKIMAISELLEPNSMAVITRFVPNRQKKPCHSSKPVGELRSSNGGMSKSRPLSKSRSTSRKCQR